MAEKSVFEQIKKQNGEAFAKAIRAYDSGIFVVSGIVDVVKYAGREAEPIIPYLESLKDVPDEKYVVNKGFIAIDGISLTVAKLIAMYYNNKCNDVLNAKYEDLVSIEGIGDVIAKEIENYLCDEDNKNRINNLLNEIEFEEVVNEESSDKLAGKVFVITGSVNHFKNRDEVKEVIEKLGGKVTGSVTGKTSFLINNDINSNSGKNKKAKELGVPIISEEDFLSMIEE